MSREKDKIRLRRRNRISKQKLVLTSSLLSAGWFCTSLQLARKLVTNYGNKLSHPSRSTASAKAIFQVLSNESQIVDY